MSTYSGKRLSTSINITCIDRDGNIVKRVTTDGGDVEDGEENENENQGGSGSSGSGNSGSQTPTVPTLTISKTGSGSSAVTVGGNAVNSGSQIAAGTEVALRSSGSPFFYSPIHQLSKRPILKKAIIEQKIRKIF